MAGPELKIWDLPIRFFDGLPFSPFMLKVLFLMLAIGTAWVSTCAHASEELMRRGGCVGCHAIADTLIGPAYRDVANRYRNQPKAFDQLFGKVREGGKGNWGNVPMPPNGEDKLSDEDLRKLLQWILAL
jgi:cytochrome c